MFTDKLTTWHTERETGNPGKGVFTDKLTTWHTEKETGNPGKRCVH